MSNDLIIRKEEYYQSATKALNQLSGIVKTTLGPNGLPILLERDKLPPLSTKDGVTVSENCFSEDPQINLIMQSIKEAAKKTNTEAGDGTTTAIVLTEAIYEKGLKLIQIGAITPQKLVTEIQKLEPFIIEKLKKVKEEVKGQEDLLNIAKISCNGDEDISNTVCEAFDLVGSNGVIQLEEGFGLGTSLRHIEGYQLDSGFASFKEPGTFFVTDPPRQQTVLDSPYIVVFNAIISDPIWLVHFVSKVNELEEGKKPHICIIAHDIVGDALAWMARNRLEQGMIWFPVKIPMIGSPNSRIYTAEDLAAFCGGDIISPFPGIKWEEIAGKYEFGRCMKIVGDRYKTTIYEGQTTERIMDARVKICEKQIETAESEFEKENWKERLGKLTGGIAIIGVGGATDFEMKEKQDRVIDSIHATRAAIQEGIVPGGGKALLNVSYYKQNFEKNSPSYLAWGVLIQALQSPFRQIAENCGDNPETMALQVYEDLYSKDALTNGWKGYDGVNRLIVDLKEDGIVDPYKVVRTALKNAISIACGLLKGGGLVIRSSGKVQDNSLENSI